MSSFAERAVDYFTGIESPENLPSSIDLMNPYSKKDVRWVLREFYYEFYQDSGTRIFVFGINPGRFGGGITGISFTDPVNLRDECGIENPFPKKRELSSGFVYKVVNKYGGARKFFQRYYLSALYPLAIIRGGKNCNYYDDEELLEFFEPRIIDSVAKQVKFGAERKFAVCLGKKNADVLKVINEERNFFGEIRILEHPRYIMQYRRKKLDHYLDKYIGALK